MKSKIPCPPAFIPVIRFDHATGLCGGILVVKRRNDPRSAKREKFGILPSAMNFVSRSGSSPSTPRMINFREPTAPTRACRQERSKLKPTAHKGSRHTNRTRFLSGAVTAKYGPASRLTMGWWPRHHQVRKSRGKQVHKLYPELYRLSRQSIRE